MLYNAEEAQVFVGEGAAHGRGESRVKGQIQCVSLAPRPKDKIQFMWHIMKKGDLSIYILFHQPSVFHQELFCSDQKQTRQLLQALLRRGGRRSACPDVSSDP